MQKFLFLLFLGIFSFTMLTIGCGNRAPAAGEPESSTSLLDTTSSGASEAVSSQHPEESSSTASESQPPETETMETEKSERNLHVQVGDSTFTATLEDNPAVDALVEMLEQGPVTIEMVDYAGFEKVGPLGTSLPTSNQQTTTQAGDLVLYQGNQIVMFYGSNAWSYTRLGKIDDLTGWEDALGDGDITVTFSLQS